MFRIIIPLVVGHMLMAKCPPPFQTKEPIQNSIRELMWPVLLIVMGFAWYVTSTSAKKGGLSADGAFALLTGLLMWWMHTQFCRDNPQQAKLILVLVVAATGVVTYIAGTHNATASIMMLPMLVWLLFAERLHIPKFRIRFPSIKVELPSIKFGGPNGGVPAPTAPKVNISA